MGRSNESLIKDYEKRASICERQAKSEWALGKKDSEANISEEPSMLLNVPKKTVIKLKC